MTMYGLRLFDSLVIPIVYLTSSWITVSSHSIKDGEVSVDLTPGSGAEVWLIGGVLAVTFAIVSVILVIKCTDCYNSEVSSESHPACGASKSTGSYGGGHSGASSYSYQSPSQNTRSQVDRYAPLPYELNPQPLNPSAPSSAPPSAPPTGPGGLGGGGWGPQNPPSQGRHYGGPEQPPTYNEATFSSVPPR